MWRSRTTRRLGGCWELCGFSGPNQGLDEGPHFQLHCFSIAAIPTTKFFLEEAVWYLTIDTASVIGICSIHIQKKPIIKYAICRNPITIIIIYKRC